MKNLLSSIFFLIFLPFPAFTQSTQAEIDTLLLELVQEKITWATIANEMFDNSLAFTRKMNFEVELKK